MKQGQGYNKSPYHEKEFDAIELKELLLQIFPKIDMYGLHPALRHRCFQRLKKIGLFKILPKTISPVERFYKNIKTSDFIILHKDLRKALDFIAVCSK